MTLVGAVLGRGEAEVRTGGTDGKGPGGPWEAVNSFKELCKEGTEGGTGERGR